MTDAGLELDRSTAPQISVRVAVLPTVAGLAAIALGVAGALLSGVAGPGSGRGNTAFLVAVVAVLLLTTMVSGSVVGLYLALAALALLGLAADGPLSAASALAMIGTMVAVHETMRFSLDARRPTRLGPGLVAGYVARAVAVMALATGVILVGLRLTDVAFNPWLMPVGLAVTAIPLFAVSLFDRRAPGPASATGRAGERSRLIDRPLMRTVLGAVLAMTTLLAATIGAQARTGIETTPGPATEPAPTTTTVVARVEPIVADRSLTETGRTALLLVVAALVLIVGFVFFVLRRSDTEYHLDELDLDEDDRTLGLAPPGRADQEQELVELSETELTRLLDGLRLDIESERDPSRAVRFGYANIERRLGGIGVPRAETETEQEFLDRALARLGPAGDPMVTLTRLFEQARFGLQPIDEAIRAEALTAVALLRAAATGQVPEGQVAPGDMARGDEVG